MAHETTPHIQVAAVFDHDRPIPLPVWPRELERQFYPLTPAVQEALAAEDAGEPAPVGAEQAQRRMGELFDRSEGKPEDAA